MGIKIICVCILLISTTFVFSADIILNNEFIEEFKNKILISGDFEVVHVPNTIHTVCTDKTHTNCKPSNDGDIHASGNMPDVGLVTVAEVLNAKSQSTAVARLRAGGTIPLVGVWRLWCEHAGSTPTFTQGEPDSIAPGDSNPDHVFEIHPVLSLGDISFPDSITKIVDPNTNKDFAPYDGTSFIKYQKKAFKIDPNQDTTTITTTQIGYNYVKFRIKILDEPANHLVVPGEGRFVFASVLNDKFNKVELQKRRMVFVEGTDSEAAVKAAHAGGVMKVLGIPRIDLAILSWRIKNPTFNGQNTRKWSLPYEMIIVGTY